MSDEQSPPPLRLRPRKREDEAAPVVVPPVLSGPTPPPAVEIPPAAVIPAFQVQEQAAPSVEPGSMRFRLKPKLSAEPEVKIETASPDSSVASTPPTSDTPASDAGAAPEIPRLKLRSLAPVAATGSEAVPLPPVIPVVAVPSIPLPPPIPAFPVVQPIVEGTLIGGLPPLPVKPASAPALPPLPPPKPPVVKAPPVSAPSPYKKKPQAKRVNTRVVLLALGGVLVLAGAGAYFFLMGAEEPAPPVVVKPVPSAPAVVAAPTPVPPELQIAPLPPQPSSFEAAANAAKLVPKPPAAPVVTPAFRSWVDQARISGVVVGDSPRAIINGRLARPGDMVDAAEGIIFDGLDAERKTLVFRSRVSAFLEKSY